MERYCQVCGCILITERKYCSSCKKQQKRDYAKARYKCLKESGLALKRYGTTTCIYCGKEVIKNRSNQNTCYSCYKKYRHKTISNYNIRI